MMKKPYIILLLVFAALESAAQNDFTQSPGLEAFYWNSRGVEAESEMQPEKALSYYKKALSLAKGTVDSLAINKILTNISSLYLSLYEYDSALEALASAEKSIPHGKNTVHETVNLKKTRADIYSKLGNHDKAVEIYKSVINMVPYGSSYYYATCHNLASAYIHAGKYAEATRYALETLATSLNARDSLSAYQMMATAASYERNGRLAQRLLDISAKLAAGINDEKSQFDFLRTKAAVYENLGLYESASAAYDTAIAAGEAVIDKRNPEVVSLIYGKAKSLLMSGNALAAIDTYQEYAMLKINYMKDLDTLLTENALYQFWINSNEGLSEAALFCREAGDSVSGEFLSLALNTVMFSKRYIYASSLRKRTSVPDWRESAKSMPEHSIAVEFTEYDNGSKYGAFIYRNNDEHPVFMEICKKSEIEAIVGDSQPETGNQIESCYSVENLVQLNKLIWEPLYTMLRRNDRIYFSPAGKLHFLPLEHLLSEKGITFSESHISAERLLSTAAIPEHNAYTNKYDGADIFVGIDYYKMSEQRNSSESSFKTLSSSINDYHYLKSTLGNHIKTVFHTGTDASEYAFKHLTIPEGSNYILHISTHGFYFSEEKASSHKFYKVLQAEDLKYLPLLRSGLALAGANPVWTGDEKQPEGKEDGILTGLEVAKMNLRGYGLVVLSACQSALGDLNSDGIMGLQSAFKLAGAGKLLVSLWPISDESASLFIKYFYSSLMSGESPETALASAAKQMRKNAKYSSPYHWAAYILVN